MEPQSHIEQGTVQGQMSLHAAIARMGTAERGHAYVQLNCFKWPFALAEFKPAKWDTMTNEERHRSEECRKTWTVLHEMVSEFDRSQAWWLEQLGRTKEQHLEWWQDQRA